MIHSAHRSPSCAAGKFSVPGFPDVHLIKALQFQKLATSFVHAAVLPLNSFVDGHFFLSDRPAQQTAAL